MSLPYFFRAVGEMIAAEAWASELMNGPKGSFRVMRRLVGESTSIVLMRLNWLYRARWFSGSRTRSRLAFTAAASNVVPSWNLTPSRSLNV